MDLQGKIAIITGCNGEFGAAIVPGFAAAGCDVACVDFKQGDADAAAEKVRQKGRRALAIAIDLRRRDEVDAMAQQVVDAFGRIERMLKRVDRMSLTRALGGKVPEVLIEPRLGVVEIQAAPSPHAARLRRGQEMLRPRMRFLMSSDPTRSSWRPTRPLNPL